MMMQAHRVINFVEKMSTDICLELLSEHNLMCLLKGLEFVVAKQKKLYHNLTIPLSNF